MTQQIYFLAHAKRIKIGTAKDVAQRVKGLTAHFPKNAKVKLLGSIDGGYPLERAIHRYLSEYHIGREWFHDCQQVRECIANLQQRGGAAVDFVGNPFRTAPPLPKKPLPEQPPMTLGRVLEFILMCEPRFSLSGLTGETEEVCEAWIAGRLEEPKLVRLALGTILMMVMVPTEENTKILRQLGAVKAA